MEVEFGWPHNSGGFLRRKVNKCVIGWFTLGATTNFNLNFMTLVIKFSLKIWLHPNLPKHPDIEV
jgi:hypothetical protein